MRKRLSLILLVVATGVAAFVNTAQAQQPSPRKSFMTAKTILQTNLPYDPRIAIAVDGIIVHRHGERGEAIRKAIQSWQQHGFLTGRMFFSDSDGANEYWTGKWDGTPHPDDCEKNQKGDIVKCSDIRPYMLPTDGWIKYLEEMTVDSVAAGVDAILPEEPLAHIDTGYEKSFQELWQKRYGKPWQPGHSSPEARFLTGQLKNELYIELERRLAEATREQAEKMGRKVPFILPIHSLYSDLASHLVAPLGTSLSIEKADGYIGQIWTGPVNWCLMNYSSPEKSFFTSAYALYDYFVQLTIGSKTKLWLLIDPVEDDPNHKWSEFEQWYRQCVVASLLFPSVSAYEVMPWPDRIFLPGHSTGGGTPAPESYRIVILSALQLQQDVPEGGEWCGVVKPTEGIGVAMADTLLWNREKSPKLNGVYGQLLPLIHAGAPVSACLLERTGEPEYLSRFKVIMLSYEQYKPLGEKVHAALAGWVSRGGSLVVLGADEGLDLPDAWWRKLGSNTPLQHLLKTVDIQSDAAGDYRFGKGRVYRRMTSPSQFADPAKAKSDYLPLVDQALRDAGVAQGLVMPGQFCMRRGDYWIAAANQKPLTQEGKFIDVFDAELPVRDGVRLDAGDCNVYRDVTKKMAEAKQPCSLHTTHRLMSERFEKDELRLVVRGPAETPAVARIFCAGRKPLSLAAQDASGKDLNVESRVDGPTIRVRFPNAPSGATLMIRWK